MLDTEEYIELLLEHGPEGQCSEGRAPTYLLDDRVVKLTDLGEERLEQNIEAVEGAGIPVPKTDYRPVNIPVYGIGEVTAVEQQRSNYTGPELFIERDECQWIEDLREIGYRAARESVKLDFGLDNFGMLDGSLVFYDIQDYESVWKSEDLPLHLMGNYLERSIERLERERDLRAPETKKMAENWKNIV